MSLGDPSNMESTALKHLPMVDVLTMQRNLYRAQRGYAQARYDYIINGLLLKQGAGVIAREDLEKVNTWLRTP